MKQYALSLMLGLSLITTPIAAHDVPDLDLPPQIAALFVDGQIDPIKFQEEFDKLPEDQKEKILKAAEAMMSKLSPEEQQKLLEEAEGKTGQLSPALNDIKHAVLSQINQISFLLQDLGQQVEVNKKLTIPNVADVKNKLASLQIDVEDLRTATMSTAILNDPHVLFNMILIIDELLRCIDEAVASKLTSIPTINQENIIKRTVTDDDLAPEKLQEHVTRNEKRLEAIHKVTNDMGASRLNRVYKSISSKIDLKKIGLGVVAAGIATYYMYRFGNDSFGAYPLDKDGNAIIPADENLFQKIARTTGLSWYKKNIPGERPRIGEALLTKLENGAEIAYRDPNYVINQDNITKFGTTVAKLEELGIFNSATAPLFTLGGMCMLFQDKIQEAIKNATNKLHKAHAYLLGKEEYRAIDEYAREPRFTLNDVEGHEHIKQEMSILPAYFADPEKMDRTGKSPGRFWMLHGNSRTGKSMLGEALAGEVKAALRAKDSSQKFTYMPITAEMLMLFGIETIMNYADKFKPCIICIDEFDLSGAQRERNSKLLAETLNAMGNAQLNDEVGNQVFFIFICNHIEHNDFALINRMDHIIEVNMPTLADRKKFLTKELNKQFIIVPEACINKMAQESEGKTVEELKRTITLAKQESFTSHQPVDEESLQRAFNQQIHKIIYSSQLPFAHDQIRQIAAYQAGKALVTSYEASHLKIAQATVLGISKKIHEVSMYSNATLGSRKQKPKDWTKYGQLFTYHADGALALETHTELINAIKLKLAGHIAQELVCGSPSANYRKNAKNKAYALASKVIFAGVDESVLPKEVKNELKKKTHELVQQCEQEVRTLLTEHKEKLELLTLGLVEYKILTGEQINQLITYKAPEPTLATPAEATEQAATPAAADAEQATA